MAAKVVRGGARQVKPILSLDREEARRRVLNLYKAWYRQIPFIGMFHLFMQVSACLEYLCGSCKVAVCIIVHQPQSVLVQ